MKSKQWQIPMVVLMFLFLVSLAGAEQAPKVNLNTATFAQLDSLPGIGVVIAERIIQFREENGPFKRIEDLMNVRGIGERTFLKLKDRITVDTAEEE